MWGPRDTWGLAFCLVVLVGSAIWDALRRRHQVGADVCGRCRVVDMHYRNGREAKNGDKVVQLNHLGKVVAVGVLFDATPGNDYCNGMIAPTTGGPVVGACMCDCLHEDDLAALLKEKGLDARPPGK